MIISKDFFEFFSGFDKKKVAECVLKLNDFEKDVIISTWGKNPRSVYNETSRDIIFKIREQLIKDNCDKFKYNFLMTKYRTVKRLENMPKYQTLIESYDNFTSTAILIVLYLNEEINDEELYIFTGKYKEDIYEIIKKDYKVTFGLSRKRYDRILNK